MIGIAVSFMLGTWFGYVMCGLLVSNYIQELENQYEVAKKGSILHSPLNSEPPKSVF